MTWILRLAFRNVLRNRRRSLLTVVTVMLGTGLLTLGLSWINGVLSEMLGSAAASAGEVRLITEEYAQREAVRPLYENIDHTGPVVEAIESLEGLAAYPVIRAGVTMTVGEEIGDDFGLLEGAPLGYFRDVLGLDKRLVEGEFLAGEGAEALLGTWIAQDLGASPGDELVVLGQTQDGAMSPLKLTVRGIVDGGHALANRQAYVSLERARWLTDIPEGALEVLVFGRGLWDAATLQEEVQALGIEGLEVQAWNAREPYASLSQTGTKIFGFLAGIIVFVTALGVLNTMILSVVERTSEVGVMRALGLERAGCVLLFVTEAACIGVVGSVTGLALALGPAIYLERVGVNLGSELSAKAGMPIASTIHGDLTPSIVVLSLGLGIAIAVLGALIPSLRAAAITPVSAMRSSN